MQSTFSELGDKIFPEKKKRKKKKKKKTFLAAFTFRNAKPEVSQIQPIMEIATCETDPFKPPLIE